MHPSRWLPLVALLALGCKGTPGEAAAVQPTTNTGDRPAFGAAGMVSTAHPLATEAGLEILDDGGNAFDAAVGIAATLNVVEPAMSGMGGYGTILIHDAENNRIRFLNPSGRIPAAVDSDVYRAPTPDYRANRRGAKAVSTPGNVNAWAAMSNEYGCRPWASLFAPAIRLAEAGYELSARDAAIIGSAYESFPTHAQAIYGVGGNPLQTGDRLVQHDLARSLRLLATDGPEVFHGGEIGAAIDRAMREAGGFLSLADLKANEAEWWEPIAIEYRGYRVYTAAPPANSFPALVRLGMMSHLDVQALGHNTVEYLHYYAEVTKHAFWTRLMYAGDPEIQPPPLDRLLSEPYWREQVGRIDAEHAEPFTPPTGFADTDGHTTHFVVADRFGNIVSATQTLGNAFGSRIMPEGTGIWLNNSLAYCTFEPAGNPMDAHAGRRKLSGDVPAIVMRDGKPWIAIGTPGGHTIAQTVPQMIMNMIDFDMDVQRAIAAPRISFIEPDKIAVEDGVPVAVRDALRAKGHEVMETRGLGNAHGLTIEYDASGRPARFTGGADPRGAGLARGY